MAMFIDPEAAPYGAFQIAFATMDTRLSRSLVTVRRCESTKFTFAIHSTMQKRYSVSFSADWMTSSRCRGVTIRVLSQASGKCLRLPVTI